MPIRFILLILLMTLGKSASALPVVDSEPCDINNPECKRVITEETAVITASPEPESDVASKGVFELVATRFVATDLSTLLDKKTAALLNTASYSIGVGKNLLGDFNARNYLVGSAGDDSYGSTPGSAMATNNNRNARWRHWATPEKERGPDRYKGSKSQTKREKEEEQATDWISRSASVVEYAAVVLLSIGFWVWLRQSKAF